MNKSKQRLAMAREYEAKGFTVTENADSSLIGLTLPFKLDLVAVDVAGSVIVEIADRARGEAESLRRFEQIKDAIVSRPEIDFEIRFYDIAAEIDQLGSEVEKLRDANPDNPAYQQIIDLMLAKGIMFAR